jgi:FixJ family two-component response regulator
MSQSNDENRGFVLLVDDEEAILESLGELLEALEFEVVTANCYESAVKVFESEDGKRLEAVISDLKMPGKSGVDVLKYLNSTKSKLPLIFLTGFGTLESCQDAVREGAFDYVLKPIDNKDKILFPLMHAIEKYRLEHKCKEMQKDIIRMANEHQKILEDLLSDFEIKDRVQQKINDILEKWDK